MLYIYIIENNNDNYYNINRRRNICLLWVMDDDHMSSIRKSKEIEDNHKTIIIHMKNTIRQA